MITLKVNPIKNIQDLRLALQQAVELEHATIPTYLTSMFSCGVTNNQNVAGIILSVVIEEMLHMSIAANTLNAIGGKPAINTPAFIPSFPGPLPGGVAHGLTVTLEKASKAHIQKVFMGIEEPEDPIIIKNNKILTSTLFTNFNLDTWDEPKEMTIGEFYHVVLCAMRNLEAEAQAQGSTIFTGSPDDQMVNNRWFPESELFPIVNIETAEAGIRLIVDQGEGTSKDPFDIEGQPAHYYRFQEIVKGFKLVEDPSTTSGYSFTGDPIPFDESLVTNTVNNPRTNNPNQMQDVYVYRPGTQEYIQNKLFNYNYSNLLNGLHNTFNGSPEDIDDAMGMMYALRLGALQLMQIELEDRPGYYAAPSFQFTTNEDLTPEELAMARKMHVKAAVHA